MPYVAKQDVTVHKVVDAGEDGKPLAIVSVTLGTGESIGDDELAPYQRDSDLLEKVSEAKAEEAAEAVAAAGPTPLVSEAPVEEEKPKGKKTADKA